MLFSFPLVSRAEVVSVREARLEASDGGGWQLNARFNFDLPAPLEEAVNKGINLYFVTEFELSRPRWYWLDEQIITAKRTVRLAYHPLIRQYAISTGGLQLRFNTFAEALVMVKSIRGWQVVDPGVLKAGEVYIASVHFSLDTSQMPKPFQVHAVNAREWNLSSEWQRFSFGVALDKKSIN